MSGESSSDPIYEAVRTIALTLNDIATLTQLIDQQIRYVTEGAERVKQSTIAHCEACGREVASTPRDRLRSGYCSKDYAKWTRQGRPYRATFEAQVVKELQETL
jgi:ribosomal protein L34E